VLKICTGKEVIRTTESTIDCSTLNNGLYIVQIEANGMVSSKKLNIAK